MYDVWYYDRDAHSTGSTTVDTMEELYEWFVRNGGISCAVLITNITEHRDRIDDD